MKVPSSWQESSRRASITGDFAPCSTDPETSEEAAFVGHEPDLGDLAATLLALPGGFPLRKGAVLALEVDGGAPKGAATFLWRTDGKGTVTHLADATGG